MVCADLAARNSRHSEEFERSKQEPLFSDEVQEVLFLRRVTDRPKSSGTENLGDTSFPFEEKGQIPARVDTYSYVKFK